MVLVSSAICSIAQLSGALDQHHSQLMRRASARTKPSEYEDFEPLPLAFQQLEKVLQREQHARSPCVRYAANWFRPER